MDFLKRFQRYTLKASAIIMNPPVPPKMVADPEGEYILVDQLVGAIKVGGLYPHTKELQTLFEEGAAHRALTRDLGKLGYDDFDQVIKVLTEQRDNVVPLKQFEVWREGWRDNGNDEKASLVGKAVARSFYDAVVILKKEQNANWNYDKAIDTWHSYLCKFYDNEKDARAFNG